MNKLTIITGFIFALLTTTASYATDLEKMDLEKVKQHAKIKQHIEAAKDYIEKNIIRETHVTFDSVDLPPELALHTLSYLEMKSNLFNLSLVNKDMRQCAHASLADPQRGYFKFDMDHICESVGETVFLLMRKNIEFTVQFNRTDGQDPFYCFSPLKILMDNGVFEKTKKVKICINYLKKKHFEKTQAEQITKDMFANIPLGATLQQRLQLIKKMHAKIDDLSPFELNFLRYFKKLNYVFPVCADFSFIQEKEPENILELPLKEGLLSLFDTILPSKKKRISLYGFEFDKILSQNSRMAYGELFKHNISLNSEYFLSNEYEHPHLWALYAINYLQRIHAINYLQRIPEPLMELPLDFPKEVKEHINKQNTLINRINTLGGFNSHRELRIGTKAQDKLLELFSIDDVPPRIQAKLAIAMFTKKMDLRDKSNTLKELISHENIDVETKASLAIDMLMEGMDLRDKTNTLKGLIGNEKIHARSRLFIAKIMSQKGMDLSDQSEIIKELEALLMRSRAPKK